MNDQGEPVDAAALEGVEPRDGVVELRVLIDRTSIEAYAFQGRQFHVRYRAPPGKPASPSIIASGGDIQIKRLAIRELQSAWRQNAAPPRAAAVP